MSLFVSSLNSGSNGNCYYVGNETEAILVDAGIPCREIEKRMKRLGLHMRKVKAVIVSHEHSDHVRGIPVLAKKYQLPIYITATTLRHARLRLEKHLVRPFSGYEGIIIGDLSITAFPNLHDASDPYNFVVASKEIKVGVFTDIGVPCQRLISHFKQCHAAFLEANYDIEMLETGSYPYYLKSRIRGGRGHLSNMQALDLFIRHRPPFMSHLFLSHLSQNNNSPGLVQELFNRHARGVKMIVASRFQETAVYHILSMTNKNVRVPRHSVSVTQMQFAFA